jgi:transposase-like protein
MTYKKEKTMEKIVEKKDRAETDKSKKKTRSRSHSPSINVSAEEKAQAVLAVWTERTKPAEVCRQLGVNWITFQQWQDRAMEGMLQALESRVNLSGGAVLSPRLQALITKRRMATGASKLESRLAKLSQNPVVSSPKQEEVMA